MYPTVKRFFDILAAGIALLILSPLLLPIVIALRVTGEGEVFYLQERVGYKKRRFKIYKFATMLKDSAKMKGGEITVRNDPRITPIGKYLRITKINELPQILNVLFGDMSVVGPRPLMPVSFEQYSPEVQSRVYDSRPGITGIGSVIFRDEEKLVSESSLPPREFYRQYIFPYKGALEMWYQDHKSFYVDFMLIILTAWVIFQPASQLPHRIFKTLPQKPQALNV